MNNKKYFYSCDLSIKSPAIIKWDDNFNFIDCLYFTWRKKEINIDLWNNINLFKRKKEIKNMNKFNKFNLISSYIIDFIEKPKKIAIEGSSYKSTGSSYIDLNQCLGFYIGKIKSNFDVDIIEFEPKKIKKFATNRGTADKPQMRKHLKKKYNWFDEKLLYFEKFGVIRFDNPIEDIVDSFFIGKYLENS